MVLMINGMIGKPYGIQHCLDEGANVVSAPISGLSGCQGILDSLPPRSAALLIDTALSEQAVELFVGYGICKCPRYL